MEAQEASNISKKSLKRKFVVSICILTSCTLVVALAAAFALSVLLVRDSNELALEQAGLVGLQEVESWFTDKEQLIEQVRAELTSFRLGEKEAIEQHLAAMNAGNEDVAQIFVGTPQNDMYSSIGWVPDAGYDCRERAWYQDAMAAGGLVYVSYIDSTVGNQGSIIVSLCLPVTDTDGTSMGVLGVDLRLGTLLDFVNREKILNTSGHAFLLDDGGNVISHTNEQFMPAAAATGVRYTRFGDTGVETGSPVRQSGSQSLTRGSDWDGVKSYIALGQVSNGWSYGFSVPLSDLNSMYYQLAAGFACVAAVTILLSLLIARRITGNLLAPIQRILRIAKEITLGKVGVETHIDIKTGDELEELARRFSRMIQGRKQQTAVVEGIANGDLTGHVEPKSESDILSITINDVVQRLSRLIDGVQRAVQDTTHGAAQMEHSSRLLADGAVSQTAAVESLSSTLDRLKADINEYTTYAQDVGQTAESAKNKAQHGLETMESLSLAVQDIADVSKDISEIAKRIEDIAFQTGIVSLNARVEAARAGKHGLTFSAVAQEVQKLATDSAALVEQIQNLSDKSARRASKGLALTGETRKALDSIMDTVGANADMVRNVNEISSRQQQEIAEVAQQAEQISQVVRQNSATAEESATVSEQIRRHADSLQQQVALFSGVHVPDSGVHAAEIAVSAKGNRNVIDISSMAL